MCCPEASPSYFNNLQLLARFSCPGSLFQTHPSLGQCLRGWHPARWALRAHSPSPSLCSSRSALWVHTLDCWNVQSLTLLILLVSVKWIALKPGLLHPQRCWLTPFENISETTLARRDPFGTLLKTSCPDQRQCHLFVGHLVTLHVHHCKPFSSLGIKSITKTKEYGVL